MKKIAMVVDDDKVAQLFLKTVMEDLGYDVIFASNGREAAGYFRSNISVITMDHNMPEMSGIEATKAIRNRERVLKMPPVWIIGITVHEDQETLDACLAAGMNQVVTKPIDPALLKGCFAQIA
jgi:two-component system CAI-1 autoinducer sensor kinase/phosphatase CqsS